MKSFDIDYRWLQVFDQILNLTNERRTVVSHERLALQLEPVRSVVSHLLLLRPLRSQSSGEDEDNDEEEEMKKTKKKKMMMKSANKEDDEDEYISIQIFHLTI